MAKVLQWSLVSALCAFLTLASSRLLAEDEAQASAGPERAQTAQDAPVAPASMEGCPNAGGGPCCSECRERLQEGKAESEAVPDCPCKRAKRLRQGSQAAPAGHGGG